MRFLIYISYAYGLPIGKPLEKEILARGYRVKWFCEDKETRDSLDFGVNLLKTTTEVMEFNPDVVLVATDVVPHFFPGVKVQIFHGFDAGKHGDRRGHYNIRGFFDLYCTQGLNTTKKFKLLAKKHKYFDVVETGWSKIDPMFQITNRSNKSKPTIMITSTFSKKMSLTQNKDVVQEIIRLSKLGKYNFICTLHPKTDKNIINRFKTYENDNFTFYDTTDLVPLYGCADMMLSDTTSAIIEFVLQLKPVVTINNTKPANYMINITDVSKIEQAIEYALSYPQDIMQNIKEFANITHPYRDGKSSARVVDACIDFVYNKQIKKKPLNLIRKYKIRKKIKQLEL